MVLTRNQAKIKREFVDNVNQMLNNIERHHKKKDKMKYSLILSEYNIKMLPILNKYGCKEYINLVYKKCLEFESEFLKKEYDECPYKLVIDFIKSNEKLKKISFELLQIKKN